MPLYRVTFTYEDAIGGTTTKSWTGEFDNDADANLAASNLRADLELCTIAAIPKMELTEITEFPASTPEAGSLVFNTVSATVKLNGTTKKANMSFPAPAPEIMSGNALNIEAQRWVDLMANFNQDNWNVSDGEYVSETVSGKRVIAASGKTNLN